MSNNEMLIRAFNTVTCSDNFYKDFGVVELIVEDDFLEYPEISFSSILSFTELDMKLNELVKKYPFIVYGIHEYNLIHNHYPVLRDFTLSFILHRINEDNLVSNKVNFEKFQKELLRKNPHENVMQAIVSPIENYYNWDSDEDNEPMEDSTMMCFLSLQNGKLNRIYGPRLSAEGIYAAENFIVKMYEAFLDGPLADYASDTYQTQIDLRSDLFCWIFDIDINNVPMDTFRKLKFETEEFLYPCFMETCGYIDTDIQGEFFRARITPDHVTIEMRFTLHDNMIVEELLEQDAYPNWIEGVDFL